jgi:hypothetical protein
MMEVVPAKPNKVLGIAIKDNNEAAKNFSYFVNDYFINAVINGEEDLNYLNTLQRNNKDSDEFVIHENWKNKRTKRRFRRRVSTLMFTTIICFEIDMLSTHICHYR